MVAPEGEERKAAGSEGLGAPSFARRGERRVGSNSTLDTKPAWSIISYYFSHAHRPQTLPDPVARGLVSRPEDWAWSSFRHYATGEMGTVEIESEWTIRRRQRAKLEDVQI